MSENSLHTKIEALQKAVDKMLKENERLNLALSAAREENSLLKQTVENQNDQLKDFQYQTKMSKIVSAWLESENHDPEDLSAMIDQYVRKIEKCIAFVEGSM